LPSIRDEVAGEAAHELTSLQMRDAVALIDKRRPDPDMLHSCAHPGFPLADTRRSAVLNKST
jgi:hypothetical protein